MRILSFDIEDWFHILDNDSTRHHAQWDRFETRLYVNMERILGLLQAREQKATFFCLGWVAEKYPDVVRKIDAAGHEVGSHSYYHQLAYEQDRNEFRQDLDRSVKILQDLTGKRVRCYRAPGFSVTEESVWALEAVVEAGIEMDCSIFAAPRAHGGVSRFPNRGPFLIEHAGMKLKEFPMTWYDAAGARVVFSGGGYFRLFPYPLTRFMARRTPYLMTYFHPRDFDPGQPVLPGLSAFRRFKSYYGLKDAFRKLDRLICDFEFVDLARADAGVDWEKAPIVSLGAK